MQNADVPADSAAEFQGLGSESDLGTGIFGLSAIHLVGDGPIGTCVASVKVLYHYIACGCGGCLAAGSRRSPPGFRFLDTAVPDSDSAWSI